jgi:hypothetical protein
VKPAARRRIAAVLAFAAAWAGGAACAAESVGRIEFDLPSPEWQTLAAYEQGLHYQNGVVIPLFTKLYALPGKGSTPKAMLVVTSTSGSHPGPTRFVTEVCPEPRAKFHTADFDSNKLTRVRECIVVNSAFVAATYFRDAEKVLQALKDRGVTLPTSAYSLRSTAGFESGSFVRVNLITARSFAGLRGGVPDAADTHGVAPALVAWAEALHRAVKSAALQPGGRLALPAIAFEDS